MALAVLNSTSKNIQSQCPPKQITGMLNNFIMTIKSLSLLQTGLPANTVAKQSGEN